jgi:hypothetical protein
MAESNAGLLQLRDRDDDRIHVHLIELAEPTGELVGRDHFDHC